MDDFNANRLVSKEAVNETILPELSTLHHPFIQSDSKEVMICRKYELNSKYIL